MTAKPNTVAIYDVRRDLHAIMDDLATYGSGELLELQHTAECAKDMIRRELRDRDARIVDEACALKIGEAA